MSIQLENSIVAILNLNGQIVGTGFLAARRVILTCAHVVRDAGGDPGAVLSIRFHKNGETRQVSVDANAWSPPGAKDVAVLRLDADPPTGVEPLHLDLGPARNSDGHPFRVFGYPTMGKFQGLWATGHIKGLVRDEVRGEMLQLSSPELAKGSSGGPVLDETTGQVAGVVSLAYFPDTTTKHRDTAFATPTEVIWELCPELRAHTRPANPFFAGGRINDPAQFFGRQQLVREIRGELKKRSSVSLVGESQMGKSSLLYYLYATGAEWFPAATVEYIDLQGVLDEADFCETVLSVLGQQGETLRDLKRALSRRDTTILLFDEVERIAEQDFNPRLHDLLRSLAQEPHFSMCLSTQRVLTDVFPARTPGGVSPFHNIFTAKSIAPFSEAEAREFLQSRLSGTGVSFPPGEIEHLLTESQCHPAWLQRMAKALFDSHSLNTAH